MSEQVAMFATYSSLGVVDLGATKTVIGSQLVKGLLEGLSPQARKSARRCPCAVTFRFGNQGTLQSEQALAIPIHGFWLKIAVAPGSTPFLLSNTLLRAIGAVIDTSRKTIFASKINKLIPIQLTERGLFLLDVQSLMQPTHHYMFHAVQITPPAMTRPQLHTHRDQYPKSITMSRISQTSWMSSCNQP